MTADSRTILITGASRGIGRAISRKLLEESYQVMGVARDFDEEMTRATGFTPVRMDLSELDRLPGRFSDLRRQHPSIDALICNAGYGRFGSLEEFSPAQIQQMIDLNLTSKILLIREFLPALKARGGGDVILMGSESALSGGRRGAVYSATKFALRGLAQSLREECSGSGVRVGIINPGMVDTDFFAGLSFRPGQDTDAHLTPEDVAQAAWLMLSARPGAAIDEINLSPQKKVIEFRKG
jgi:3-hydroxy acid dehydrogenase / malonic semialdehyde reductase